MRVLSAEAKCMKLKRRIPYIFVFLILLVYVLSLVISGLSNSGDLIDEALLAAGHGGVNLSAGRVSARAESFQGTVTAEDIALFEGFTDLKSADFSGSTCYREIAQYAAAHPEVNVKYTVTLPNGQIVENNASHADLSGISSSDLPAVAQLMQYLPEVRTVSLGTVSPGRLSADDIASLRAFIPQAAVDYSVNVLGNACRPDTTELNLASVSSSAVHETASAFSLLPNLQKLYIPDNATTNGTLTWDDLAVLSSACPGAAVEYRFSVCGVNASMADQSLDLNAITHADVDQLLKVLPGMSQLTYLDIGGDYNDLTWDDISAIQNACPNAALSFTTSICGRAINLNDSVLDLNHVTMNDQGEAVRRIVPFMKNLTYLDMDFCNVDNSHMAQIRDENPNVNVVWRVWFGNGGRNGYSVRTDVETILASKPSAYGQVTDADGEALKYCTKVKHLDLGHNDKLTDCSFVAYMPELYTCIMTKTSVRSLEPFRNCLKLDYLEIADANLSDLSPLTGLTNLKHLNIGLNKGITDLSPLYSMTGLKRIYYGGCGNPSGQNSEIKEVFGVSYDSYSISDAVQYAGNGANYYTTTEGMWRYDQVDPSSYNIDDPNSVMATGVAKLINHPRYEEVRETFRYSEAPYCYSAASNDPLYDPHD